LLSAHRSSLEAKPDVYRRCSWHCLSSAYLPGILSETWENMENKDLDLNVESHRPRKLTFCPELKLEDTLR